MGGGMLFFSDFAGRISDGALLTALVAVPLVLGMLVLLVLVNEVSRLRSLEHSQRLIRNIWDDQDKGTERFWDPGEDHVWDPEGLSSREYRDRETNVRLFPH